MRRQSIGWILSPVAALTAATALASVTVPTDVRSLADTLRNEQLEKEKRSVETVRLRSELAKQASECRKASRELTVGPGNDLYDQRAVLEEQYRQIGREQEALLRDTQQREAAPAPGDRAIIRDNAKQVAKLDRKAALLAAQIDRFSKQIEAYKSEADSKVVRDNCAHDVEYLDSSLNETVSGRTDWEDRRSIFFSAASKLYTWIDKHSNKGSQFLQTIALALGFGHFDVNVETGWISSNAHSGQHGKVSTPTDTSVGVTYTHEQGDRMF